MLQADLGSTPLVTLDLPGFRRDLLAEAGAPQGQFCISGRNHAVQKGNHLLIDCRNVARELCANDKLVLETMAQAAEQAGANVISAIRYKFGQDSPPGFTAIVMLDESHCSAHSYADLGLIAMDIFTCGKTDPREVLRLIRSRIDLGDVTVRAIGRFIENKPDREDAFDASLAAVGA
jgi:S-adenosylmethionine decarboxylase